jgi:hypothetical protein
MNMSYDFEPGKYIGDLIWRGKYTLYWADYPISCGTYELRLYNGTQATLALVDGELAHPRGADVDLGIRIMFLKGAAFRP